MWPLLWVLFPRWPWRPTRALCPQVVGNLLYYRFLNPAVVAPDAFDVVALAAGGVLAAPQRHTLGAVAQLLQHAAARKAFSGESPHLRVLNDYVEETYPKFRSSVLPPPLLSSFMSRFPSLEPTRKRGTGVRRRVRGLEERLADRRGG